MAAAATGAFAQKGETVKIAMIEGLSGPFANVGQNQLKSWQFVAEHFSAPRTRPASSSRSSASTTRARRRKALNRSRPPPTRASATSPRATAPSVGAAAVRRGRQAQRAQSRQGNRLPQLRRGRPGADQREVQLLALPPGRRHLHEDGGADHLHEGPAQDQEGLPASTRTTRTASRSRSTSRKAWRASAPTCKIVGEDLHPLGQVKDFAPYVAKIKQSGADTIVTGNWGQDLTLLIKALNDAGLKVPMYTYYAGVSGTPTALAAGGELRGLPDRLQPLQLHRARWASSASDFQKKFNDDYLHLRDLQRHRAAGRGDGQGQVDRPGQGGERRWKA